MEKLGMILILPYQYTKILQGLGITTAATR